MKYIDADKLIAEIRRIVEEETPISKGADYYHGVADTADKLLSFIASLQQEQPEKTCRTCGFYENNCPFIRGKLIPYPNKVCKDYTYSAMKEEQQPEVDLEKEIEEHALYMPHGEFASDNEIEEDMEWARKEFRHFYELGLNARKED